MPHDISPDRAISLMQTINKFDDPEVLAAAIELVNATHCQQGEKGDAAQAALRWAYRQTTHCAEQCKQYLELGLFLLPFLNLILQGFYEWFQLGLSASC